MRRRMAGSTAQGSRSMRSALIREAPDARAGAEAESWHARGGTVRILNPNAKSEATPSRPFVNRHNRLHSVEPADRAGRVDCRNHSTSRGSWWPRTRFLRHPRPSAAAPHRRPGIQHKTRRRHTIGIAARLDERDWAMPDKICHAREGGRLRQKANGSRSTTRMAAAAAMTRRDSTGVVHMKEKPRQTAPHARRSSEISLSTITGTRADDQDAHRDRHLWPD